MGNKSIRSDSVCIFMAFSISLIIYGAIPFLALPTLGQALGTTVGFAQSLLNESGFSLYAKNFGYPTPMPRSFGLAGVLVTGFFLWIGFSPADAYTSMAVLFLALAFWGAYRLSLFLGSSKKLASVLALLWLSQPIVWSHSGYSMLSLGIALLPFYLYAALLLCTPCFGFFDKSKHAILFIFVCIVSVFMDGYSYMMFAVGASFIWVVALYVMRENRFYILSCSAIFMFIGFGFSYVLYSQYIGQASFPSSPIDFFRGWGLDLSFIVTPTQGVHWLWEFLNISIQRSSDDFFGDSSVWITTFSLPIITVGVFAWWVGKKWTHMASLFLLISIFAFYMSLGPSLKVCSTKNESSRGEPTDRRMMPEDMALMPTGNSFIYENIPGFKSMRATYRWHALFIFGMWGLVIILAVRSESKGNRLAAFGIPFVLFLTVIPDPISNFSKKIDNRESAFQLDEELLLPLGENISTKDKVAFLPYRNDILVNYLSSRLDFTTYNVGGDKNLAMAKSNWPFALSSSGHGLVDHDIEERVYHLLSQNQADAIVLLYVDSIKAIHSWPSPIVYKKDFAPIVSKLKASEWVDVGQHEYFAVIKPSDDLPEKYQMNRSGFSVEKFHSESYNSQVGELLDESLASTGKEGFLHFGPYKYLPAGKYGLIVRGTSYSSETGWVDVVSEKGRVKHFGEPLSDSAEEGVLSRGEFELEKDVTDLEVRFFVTREDRVNLQGYEVFRVEEASLEK